MYKIPENISPGYYGDPLEVRWLCPSCSYLNIYPKGSPVIQKCINCEEDCNILA